MAKIIRKASFNDVEQITTLYNTLIDYLDATHNYPGWAKNIYPTSEDAFLGIKEEALFVLEVNSHIAGTIILRHKPEEGYRNAHWKVKGTYDQIYVIYTLAVHPNYLHQGIGGALLQFAEDLGKEEKCVALRLDVVKGNTPAIRLYQKCGFQYIDTVSLGYEAYGLPWYELYEKPL